MLSDTGWIFFRRQDLDGAQQYLERALATVAPLANDQEEANILNRLGGVAWTRGDVEQARQYVERRLAASERSGDLVGQAWSLMNLGLLAQSRDMLDDAVAYNLRAVEIADRMGNRRIQAIVSVNLGGIYYDQEMYAQAHLAFTQALTLSGAVRDSYTQTFALLGQGRALGALGQLEAAERAIVQSQFLAAQLQLPEQQLEGSVALAEFSLRKGDVAAAIHNYQEALPLVDDHTSGEFGELQRLEARIAFAQGDRTRALALLAEVERLFTNLQNMPETRRTARLREHLASTEDAARQKL